MRRDVDASALGRIIASVKVLDTGVLEDVSADGLRRALTGRALTRTDRHGKQLFFRIGRGRWLTVHLGMTGDLILLENGQDPPRFTRVRLDFEDGASLVYEDMRKFGAIGLTPSKSAFLERKRLGPDALEIKREDFMERASLHRRSIKTVLLDQSVLAGVGNLYSDEALFQCGVHPMALADELSEDRLGCIHRNLVNIMDRSIKVGTDFDSLPEGYLLKDPPSNLPLSQRPRPMAYDEGQWPDRIFLPTVPKAMRGEAIPCWDQVRHMAKAKGTTVELARPDEAEVLTSIQTATFDDDTRRHLGKPRGGPYGYDSLEFCQRVDRRRKDVRHQGGRGDHRWGLRHGACGRHGLHQPAFHNARAARSRDGRAGTCWRWRGSSLTLRGSSSIHRFGRNGTNISMSPSGYCKVGETLEKEHGFTLILYEKRREPRR